MKDELYEQVAIVIASDQRIRKQIEERTKTLEAKIDAINNVEKTSKYPGLILREYKKLFHDVREIYVELLALYEDHSQLVVDALKRSEKYVHDCKQKISQLETDKLLVESEKEVDVLNDQQRQLELAELSNMGILDPDIYEYFLKKEDITIPEISVFNNGLQETGGSNDEKSASGVVKREVKKLATGSDIGEDLYEDFTDEELEEILGKS